MKGILTLSINMGLPPVTWNTCSTAEYEANEQLNTLKSAVSWLDFSGTAYDCMYFYWETFTVSLPMCMGFHIQQLEEYLCLQTRS